MAIDLLKDAKPIRRPRKGKPCPSVPPAAEGILDLAKAATSGPRRRDYGTPKKNHENIAALWDAYLAMRPGGRGQTISALDAGHMMILLKVARVANSPTKDSYVDTAGYARCCAQIAGLESEEIEADTMEAFAAKR